MYIIVRITKVQKGFGEQMKERFLSPSPIDQSPGFVKRELLFNGKNPDYDELRTMFYFEDKKAFYIWEGSPAHIAMHKNRDPQAQRPAEILEVTKEVYELIASKSHE